MTDAQLRVSKGTLIQTVTVLDTSFEQPLERDIVLPDYCPDVFRILKCRVCPRAVSQSINGGRLTVGTEAVIRVMYLSENSGRINQIEQKLSFTKTLEAGDCTDPVVYAAAEPDYVNCRVVSQRRIDIRGAFTVKVRVEGEESRQFVTDAGGAGIQLRREEAVYPADRLTSQKRVTVVEELELGGAKPPVGTVLYSGCRIESTEQKVIQGKLMIKGEAAVELLYTPADPSAGGVETMRFGLPFSQIIDIDGIDESYTVTPVIQAPWCELIPRADDGSRIECELVLMISCTAVRYEHCGIVTDAFSTLYECSTESSGIRLTAMPSAVCAEFSQSGTLCYQDGTLGSIAFAGCEAGNITVRESGGRSVISGNLTFSMLGSDSEGTAVYLEDEMPFEFTADGEFINGVQAEVRSCSYQLTDEHTASVKAELAVTGQIAENSGIVPLADIAADTDAPVETDRRFAMKLCYADEGEDLWELAKRCRTSVEAIAQENGLTSDRTEAGGMLMIPLIN